MRQKANFLVHICGFSEAEERLILSAIRLSEIRRRSYTRWDNTLHKGRPPDIYLVNDDQPESWDLWLAFCNHYKVFSSPLLSIGGNSHALHGELAFQRHLQRPILANRLLKALDDLLSEVYAYIPG